VGKVEKVMGEYGEGKLHSRSKKGPIVTSRDQAIAIGLSEARKAGENVPAKAKRKVHHSPTMTEIDNHKTHTVNGQVMEHASC